MIRLDGETFRFNVLLNFALIIVPATHRPSSQQTSPNALSNDRPVQSSGTLFIRLRAVVTQQRNPVDV